MGISFCESAGRGVITNSGSRTNKAFVEMIPDNALQVVLDPNNDNVTSASRRQRCHLDFAGRDLDLDHATPSRPRSQAQKSCLLTG